MNTKGIRAIVTGATGMVGEGVMHECLQHPDVEAVLLINRKASGFSHPKLKEIITPDLFDLSGVEQSLAGYDACYFCLGVSSVGMKAAEYERITYQLTMYMAGILSRLNPSMVFCYVSGAGTDSSEKGRVRWARVKGKTENDLMKLPFRWVFGFRPGFIKPTKGLVNTHAFYKYINWMFPLGRALAPNGFCTLRELGLAMIHVTEHGYAAKLIEGRDIIHIAAIEIGGAGTLQKI
jgi:hypothetical protein